MLERLLMSMTLKLFNNSINESFFNGLKYLSKISSTKPENSFLIYGGNENQKRTDFEIISWENLKRI